MATKARKDSKGYALRLGECQRNDGYLCGGNCRKEKRSNDKSGRKDYNKIVTKISRCISSKRSVFDTDRLYLDLYRRNCNVSHKASLNEEVDTVKTTDSFSSTEFCGLNRVSQD